MPEVALDADSAANPSDAESLGDRIVPALIVLYGWRMKNIPKRLPDFSNLRKPPAGTSRRQIHYLDGIRYSHGVAWSAYRRLFDTTMATEWFSEDSREQQIALLVSDAWTIVDSIHRFHDLLLGLPGLKKKVEWVEYFKRDSSVVTAAELRNCVQHQNEELADPDYGPAPVWGYLRWAELQGGQYTGQWFVATPGATFGGDIFWAAGSAELPDVPEGQILLDAFGRRLYLGRGLLAIGRAATKLDEQVGLGALASDRGAEPSDAVGGVADSIIAMSIPVLLPPTQETEDKK